MLVDLNLFLMPPMVLKRRSERTFDLPWLLHARKSAVYLALPKEELDAKAVSRTLGSTKTFAAPTAKAN